MNGDDFDGALARALVALYSLGIMWLAAHPDTIDQAVYRFKLWRAYHPRGVNTARLRHMRALRWAGAYDDDLRPEKAE